MCDASGARRGDAWRAQDDMRCLLDGTRGGVGVQDHFLLSARKASKDKTRLDVVGPAKLMIEPESQERRLRVPQRMGMHADAVM